MSRKAVNRFGKRAAARLRAIRLRAAEWQRKARRAATLALIAAGTAAIPSLAEAQTGQMAMTPAGGIVNRAVAGFQGLNLNGPGYLYYGLNGADRGLGYNGSYMTLGGFIPYSEDDLGGLWSADLRGHLSVNGGFFSNVGLVRKQFLGGSLLGVGVYWDFDGDQNQYPAFGVAGTEFGQFGHSYNQVGVSGEWLTDFGNLRSNGYMPVGTTAYTAGAPNSPFYQNYVMCQYGLDAALSGADLEVGAYIPGLSDWAGMISVGGYALGNSRYNWWSGPQTGQDVVPWFGGVYTRLDMTFIENWDFSLQANNDSYFDWTGFARLTYRMGGSRRRNVPDQMEQPMMRNEHIVRAHQTPIVALNGDNGNTPWRVIHVNNAAPSGGTGTAESPLNTLAQASAAAANPYDIVFVHRGLSRTSTPYGGTFAFGNANQYLIGDGLGFAIPTVTCGPLPLSTGSGLSPLLSNPAGDSIAIDGAIAGGATVAGIDIIGSRTGIYATGPLTSAAGRPLTVQNVSITGNGTTAAQEGVYLEAASGKATFADTSIANMTTAGFTIAGTPAGPLDVDYQGSITNDTALNGGAVAPIVYIADTAGGTINMATGGGAAGSTVPNQISDTGGSGIQIVNNAAATNINIGNVSLTNNVQTAIAVVDDNSTTTITAGSGTGIVKQTNGAAISVLGGAPTLAYTGPITNGLPATGATSSYLLSVANTTGGKVTLTAPDTPFIDTGNGITINNAGGDVTVDGVGAKITSAGGQGILIDGGSSGDFLFKNMTILGATNAGVLINNAPGSTTFEGLNVNLTAATAVGFQANNAGAITALVGANSITNASTSQAAVEITGSGPLDMSFTSIASGNITATPGSPTALMFDTSPGTFSVTSQFTTGGSPGSISNVTNDGGTTVNLPP